MTLKRFIAVAGVLGTLIVAPIVVWAITDYLAKYPTLEVAGEPRVLSDQTLIPLRTTSSVPVKVGKVYFQIRPDLICCAAIENEEPIKIDGSGLKDDQWYLAQNVAPFQIKVDDLTELPVQVFDTEARQVILHVVIRYGDDNSERLDIYQVKVNTVPF